MKRIVAILTLAFVIIGCGKSSENPLHGTWSGFPETESRGIKLNFKLKLEESTATVINSCTYPDGSIVSASVAVPIQVTADTIKFTEAREHEEKDGAKSCTARVEVGELKYELQDGGHLKVSKDTQSYVLNRE